MPRRQYWQYAFFTVALVAASVVVVRGCDRADAWLALQVEIDHCFDSGGRWHYERGACDYADDHPDVDSRS